MGFRFRKSMKIAPGIRLNLGKKGVGMSFGGKGFRYSVNSSGRRTTSVSGPGTGLSYSTSSTKGSKKAAKKAKNNPYKPKADKPAKDTALSSMIFGIFAVLTGCGCLGGFLGLWGRKLAKNSIDNFGPSKCNKIGLISSYIGIGLALLAMVYGLIFGEPADNDSQSARQTATVTTLSLPTTEAPTTEEMTTEEATTEEITTEEATTEKPKKKKTKKKKKKKTEQAPQEEQVWISNSGSKYHSNANCSGMKNPSQVSISTAKNRGLAPCKRCY